MSDAGNRSNTPDGMYRATCRCILLVSLTAAVWGLVVAGGCGQQSPDKGTADGNEQQASAKSMRIVCLSPALTDILIDLNLGRYIVGRDTWEHQLDGREPMVPRVGDLSHLEAEALVALAPTDIVFQKTVGGPAPKLREVADRFHWNLVSVRLDSLDDVTHAVLVLVDTLSYGSDPGSHCELRSAAIETSTDLLKQLEQSDKPYQWQSDSEAGCPILFLYSLDPPAAFGPGSYLHDLSTRLGGANAVRDGRAWQEMSAESLLLLDPGAIVIVREGPPGVRVSPAADDRLHRLDLRCVAHGRVFEMTHPQILLPGTSMALEVPGLMRDLFAQLEAMPASTGGGG